MVKASHGINPVTFRGTDNRSGKPTALTMSRLHVGFEGKLSKLFSVMMYDESKGVTPKDAKEAEDRIQGFVCLDEDHFLEGIYHLFPAGEMDHGDTAAASINGELLTALKTAVAALKGLGASEESLIGLEGLLKRIGEP